MVILSVDLGKVRTGTAVCDKNEIIASSLEMIREPNHEKLAEKIKELVVARKAELIVVGLPKNMDGSEGDSALYARSFGKQLKLLCDIDVDFFDERGTTVTAHNYLNITNTRGKKRKESIDSVSAVIILEDYMRSRKNRLDLPDL